MKKDHGSFDYHKCLYIRLKDENNVPKSLKHSTQHCCTSHTLPKSKHSASADRRLMTEVTYVLQLPLPSSSARSLLDKLLRRPNTACSTSVGARHASGEKKVMIILPCKRSICLSRAVPISLHSAFKTKIFLQACLGFQIIKSRFYTRAGRLFTGSSNID